MKTSVTRTLWWGIGLIFLAVIALLLYIGTGVQASLSATQAGQSVYFWLVSPLLAVVQNVGFPLGAALIAASVVLRHINHWQSPLVHQQQELDPTEDTPQEQRNV